MAQNPFLGLPLALFLQWPDALRLIFRMRPTGLSDHLEGLDWLAMNQASRASERAFIGHILCLPSSLTKTDRNATTLQARSLPSWHALAMLWLFPLPVGSQVAERY